MACKSPTPKSRILGIQSRLSAHSRPYARISQMMALRAMASCAKVTLFGNFTGSIWRPRFRREAHNPEASASSLPPATRMKNRGPLSLGSPHSD